MSEETDDETPASGWQIGHAPAGVTHVLLHYRPSTPIFEDVKPRRPYKLLGCVRRRLRGGLTAWLLRLEDDRGSPQLVEAVSCMFSFRTPEQAAEDSAVADQWDKPLETNFASNRPRIFCCAVAAEYGMPQPDGTVGVFRLLRIRAASRDEALNEAHRRTAGDDETSPFVSVSVQAVDSVMQLTQAFQWHDAMTDRPYELVLDGDDVLVKLVDR